MFALGGRLPILSRCRSFPGGETVTTTVYYHFTLLNHRNNASHQSVIILPNGPLGRSHSRSSFSGARPGPRPLRSLRMGSKSSNRNRKADSRCGCAVQTPKDRAHHVLGQRVPTGEHDAAAADGWWVAGPGVRAAGLRGVVRSRCRPRGLHRQLPGPR